MVVTKYEGDEVVTEFTFDKQDPEWEAAVAAELARLDEGIVYEGPTDEYPFGDPDQFEQQVLAWREADGIVYDGLAIRRHYLIEAAVRRGDLAALAILGVGGRRFA